MDKIAYELIAKDKTQKHISRVAALIGQFVNVMVKRGLSHDKSKFDPEELGPLAALEEVIDTQGQAPFGTDEYERRKREYLAPMLEHHYANNSHHPEHYENGVAGMTLYDVVEMFLDWKAASERGEESAMNLTFAIERYGIQPPLSDILINTAIENGWPYK